MLDGVRCRVSQDVKHTQTEHWDNVVDVGPMFILRLVHGLHTSHPTCCLSQLDTDQGNVT